MKIEKMLLKQIIRNKYLPDEVFDVAQISNADLFEKDNLIIVKKCDLEINEFYYNPLTEMKNLFLCIGNKEPILVSIKDYKINGFGGTAYLELLVKPKRIPRIIKK